MGGRAGPAEACRTTRGIGRGRASATVRRLVNAAVQQESRPASTRGTWYGAWTRLHVWR